MHVDVVPSKQLDSALRHARSQDDLTSSSSTSPACASSAERSPHTEPVTVSGTSGLVSLMSCEFDDADCWSQEDDDIIQVTTMSMRLTFDLDVIVNRDRSLRSCICGVQ